jgi:tripartite-type tricarboxylate transporter receptor subunit TctC
MKTLCALFLLAASVSAQAQSNVIRLIVPFGSGAVQDTGARSISNELGALLGKNVIVENRAGAGGTIGNASVAKSPPDGNTLVYAASSHTISGHMYAKLPYHPLNDFTPVAHIGSTGYVLLTSAQVPAKSVREFVEHAKANPGKLNYASAGVGSATHLSLAYFASLAGIDMVHVPFKSTGDAVNEVLAGRAQAVSSAYAGAIGYLKDSRVRALGVSDSRRSRFVPDLPTIAESGVPGYEFVAWTGLLGPAGIPRPVVEAINAAMAKVLRDPVVVERYTRQGLELNPMTAEAFGALLRADFEAMGKVVKAAGARIE